LKANQGFEFLGWFDDIRPILAGTSVFVLPSYREGLPRSVIEAMSMGRPIITTDVPGCRQTVEDGVNGYLVPVKNVDALVDRMVRFIDRVELIPAMGRESRRIAEEKFDVNEVNRKIWDTMALESDE
jgi:glycosyltransferase involved in cell wall biosynthesis